MVVSSYFYSPRAQRFATMFQVDTNFIFAAKCLIKYYPFRSLLLLYSFNVLVGAYMIRMWEKLIIHNIGEDLDNYLNSCWYLIVSIVTVGIGDYIAKTTISRFIVCFAIIIGIFINSSLIVVLTEYFTFRGGELKAFNMLNQIELREKMNECSKKLLLVSFKYHLNRGKKQKCSRDYKKYRYYEDLETKYYIKINRLLNKYRVYKEEVKETNKFDVVELIIDRLMDARKTVLSINEKINLFESVYEQEKENQRNLEALKTTVFGEE